MVDRPISHLIRSNIATLQMIQHAVAKENAMQIESKENLNDYFQLNAFNPMQRARNFKELTELASKGPSEEKETDETKEPEALTVAKIEDAASRFQRNNFEMNAKTLLILRAMIKANDSPDEVLSKVMSVYSDPALADEALDFLIETADPQTLAVIKLAKEKLNTTFERQVAAGRNIAVQARTFSEAGLGSPTSLRDMYRDITGAPRDPLILFNELTEKFRFEKLKGVIHFLLHALGSDLKSKGPSIDRAELKRLIDETRSLQGILGVFRFFQSRMNLMQKQFAAYGLILPSRLDFEALARLFIKILAERYVNSEKIMQTARLLGIEEEVAAQIVVYTQMRDAIRQIAPRYFREPRHREEQLRAYIDTIEKLEDKLEEEEEKEREK